MSWRSSSSPTPLWRECHHEVWHFRCYGECLHEVPLPQLRTWGNVMSKSCFCNSRSEGNVFTKFRNFAVDGNIFVKFCFRIRTLGGRSWRSPVWQLWSEGNVFKKLRNSAVMGNVFRKFFFRNSAHLGMSSQSFCFDNSALREISCDVPLPQSRCWG